MALTTNIHVLEWVADMAALCQPDRIEWIDGSEHQLDKLLCQQMKVIQSN